jgi:hypothetical protein
MNSGMQSATSPLKRALRLVAGASLVLLGGITANFITGHDDLIAFLKRTWLWLAVAGGALIVDQVVPQLRYLLPRLWMPAEIERLLFRMSFYYNAVRAEALRDIFQMFVDSTSFPRVQKSFNIDLFVYQQRNRSSLLVKDPHVAYYGETVPAQHRLEMVETSSPLVICRAFNTRTSVLEKLPTDHIAHYPAELRDYVDPSLKWVFACPVRRQEPGDSPIAIICCTGRTMYFQSAEEEKRFEILLFRLSDIVARILSFEEGYRLSKTFLPTIP